MKRLVAGLLAAIMVASNVVTGFASGKYTSYMEDGYYDPLSDTSAYESYGTIGSVGFSNITAGDLDDIRRAANADLNVPSANDIAKQSGEKVNLDTQKVLYGMGTLTDYMQTRTVTIKEMEAFAWSFVISQFAEPYVESLYDVFDHEVFRQMADKGLELDPYIDATSGAIAWNDLFGSGKEVVSVTKFNEIAEIIKNKRGYNVLFDDTGVQQLTLSDYLEAPVGSIFYIRDRHVYMNGVDDGDLWMNRNDLAAHYSSEDIQVDDILIPVYVQSNVNVVNNQLNLTSFLKGQVTGDESNWTPSYESVITSESGSMGSALMYMDSFGNICCYHNNKMKMVLCNAQNTIWTSYPDDDDESWLNSSEIRNINGQTIKGDGEDIESVLKFSMFSAENGGESQYLTIEGDASQEEAVMKEYLLKNIQSDSAFSDIGEDEAFTVYCNEALNVYNKPWMTMYSKRVQTGAWDADKTMYYTGGASGVLNDYPSFVQFTTAANASKRNSVVFIKPSYLIEEALINTSTYGWTQTVESNNSEIAELNNVADAKVYKSGWPWASFTLQYKDQQRNDKIGIATLGSLLTDKELLSYSADDTDFQKIVISPFRWNVASAFTHLEASDKDFNGGENTWVDVNMKYNIGTVYKSEQGLLDYILAFFIGSSDKKAEDAYFVLPTLSTISSRITADGLLFPVKKDVVYNNAVRRSLPVTYWSMISAYGEKFAGLTPWIRLAGTIEAAGELSNAVSGGTDIEVAKIEVLGKDLGFNKEDLEGPRDVSSEGPKDVFVLSLDDVNLNQDWLQVDNDLDDEAPRGESVKSSVIANGGYTHSKGPINGDLGEGNIIYTGAYAYNLKLPAKLMFEPGYNRSVLAVMSSDFSFVNKSMQYSVVANESGGKAYSVGSMYMHTLDYGQYWTAVNDALAAQSSETYISGMSQSGRYDQFLVKHPAQTSEDDSVYMSAGLLVPYLKEYCTLSKSDIEALEAAVAAVGTPVDFTEADCLLPQSAFKKFFTGAKDNYWYDPEYEGCDSVFHKKWDNELLNFIDGTDGVIRTSNSYEAEQPLQPEDLACLIRGWLNSVTSDSKGTDTPVLRSSMLYYDQLVLLLRDTRISDTWTIYGKDDVSLLSFVWMNYYLPKSPVFRSFIDGCYNDTELFDNFQYNYYFSGSLKEDNSKLSYEEYREQTSVSSVGVNGYETIFGEYRDPQWHANTVIIGPYLECFTKATPGDGSYSISASDEINQRFNYKLYPDTSPTPCLLTQAYIENTGESDETGKTFDVKHYGQNYVSINIYDLFMGVYRNTAENINMTDALVKEGSDTTGQYSRVDILTALTELVRNPGATISNIISTILQFAHGAMTEASFANFFQLSWLTNTEQWQSMLTYYFLAMFCFIAVAVFIRIIRSSMDKKLRSVSLFRDIIVNFAICVVPLILIHSLVFTTDGLSKSFLSGAMDKASVAETSAYNISTLNDNLMFETGYQLFRDQFDGIEDTTSQYTYQVPKMYLNSIDEFIYTNKLLQSSIRDVSYSSILSNGIDRWYDYRGFVPVHKNLYSQDLYYYFYDYIKYQYIQYLATVDAGQAVAISQRAYEFQFGADPDVLSTLAGAVPDTQQMLSNTQTVTSANGDTYEKPLGLSKEDQKTITEYLNNLRTMFTQEFVSVVGNQVVADNAGEATEYISTDASEEKSNRVLYIQQLEKSIGQASGDFVVMMTDPTYIYGASFSTDNNTKFGGYFLEDMFGLGTLFTDMYAEDEAWEPSDELYKYLGWEKFKNHSSVKKIQVGSELLQQNTKEYLDEYDAKVNTKQFGLGSDIHEGRIYGSQLALMSKIGFDKTIDRMIPATALERDLEELTTRIYNRVCNIIRFFPAETTNETYISLAAMAASFEFTQMFNPQPVVNPMEPTGYLDSSVSYNSVLRGIFARSPNNILNSREIMYMLIDNNNSMGLLPCFVIFLSDIAAFILAILRNFIVIAIFVCAVFLTTFYSVIKPRKNNHVLLGITVQCFGVVGSHAMMVLGLNTLTNLSASAGSAWKDTIMALLILLMFVADSYVHFVLARSLVKDFRNFGGKIFADKLENLKASIKARMNSKGDLDVRNAKMNAQINQRTKLEKKRAKEEAALNRLESRLNSMNGASIADMATPLGWMRIAANELRRGSLRRRVNNSYRKMEGLNSKIGSYDAELAKMAWEARIGSDARFDRPAQFRSARDAKLAERVTSRLGRNIDNLEMYRRERATSAGIIYSDLEQDLNSYAVYSATGTYDYGYGGSSGSYDYPRSDSSPPYSGSTHSKTDGSFDDTRKPSRQATGVNQANANGQKSRHKDTRQDVFMYELNEVFKGPYVGRKQSGKKLDDSMVKTAKDAIRDNHNRYDYGNSVGYSYDERTGTNTSNSKTSKPARDKEQSKINARSKYIEDLLASSRKIAGDNSVNHK